MQRFAFFKNVRAKIRTQDSRSIGITVMNIPLDKIEMRNNIRLKETDIKELAESIRENGLIQPIIVYPDGDIFIVKIGHRRLMAYKLLNNREPDRFWAINCIISDGENSAIFQLVENIHRHDLSQVDLCDALSGLRDQGLSIKKIADVIGKSEWYLKSLFSGINEIQKNEKLRHAISVAGNTIRDIV